MVFSCLIVFDVFVAFTDLSVKAYATNVNFNITSKKKSLSRGICKKRERTMWVL